MPLPHACVTLTPSRNIAKQFTRPPAALPQTRYLTGYRLIWRQWVALITKRTIQWTRSYKLLFVLVVLPILLTIIGLTVVSTLPLNGNEPPRPFDFVSGYSANTLWFSQADAGGDHYSGAYDSVQHPTAAILSQDGLRPPNLLQQQMMQGQRCQLRRVA